MIITVDNSNTERQQAVVTIDTKHCIYPYAIREAIEVALRLDGYSEECIDSVFGRERDAKANGEVTQSG
jgi:hypothetical protein